MRRSSIIIYFLAISSILGGCNYPNSPKSVSAPVNSDNKKITTNASASSANSSNPTSANSCSHIVVDHNPGIYNSTCSKQFGKYASCTSYDTSNCYECMLPSRALINSNLAPTYYTFTAQNPPTPALQAGDKSMSDLSADDFQIVDYTSPTMTLSSSCATGIVFNYTYSYLTGILPSIITFLPVSFSTTAATVKKVTLNNLNLSVCETTATVYGCLYQAPVNTSIGVYNMNIIQPNNQYLIVRIGEPPTINPNTGIPIDPNNPN